MRKYLLLILLLSTAPLTKGQDRLNDFDAVLPQVARGVGNGVQVETTIVIVRPARRTGDSFDPPLLSVQLSSTDEGLFPATTLELLPGETVALTITGEQLLAGAVRIRSIQSVSASAIITTRRLADPETVASTVTVLAQPLVSMVSGPVFFQGRPGGAFATIENTSVAVLFRAFRNYEAILRDSSGQEIARRQIRDVSGPQWHAQFIDELFPGKVEPGFVGSFHLFGIDFQARAFSVIAFYSTGAELRPAEMTPVDVGGVYEVKLEEGSTLQELQAQYEFTIVIDGGLLIGTRDSIATALERDPRVQQVLPSSSPFFLSAARIN